MVIVSPLSRVVPIPNGLNGLQTGVTNHLVTGMILQVGALFTPLIGVKKPSEPYIRPSIGANHVTQFITRGPEESKLSDIIDIIPIEGT